MKGMALHPLLEERKDNPQRLRQLASHARWAAEAYASLPPERIAEITRSAGRAIADQADRLAKAIVEESGLGVVADWARLIRGVTEVNPLATGLQTNEGMLSIVKPAGVVLVDLRPTLARGDFSPSSQRSGEGGAERRVGPVPLPQKVPVLHPRTPSGASRHLPRSGGGEETALPAAVVALQDAPVSLVRSTLFCLATGNAVLLGADEFDPICVEAVRHLCRAVEKAGAPSGLIQMAEGAVMDADWSVADGLIDAIIRDSPVHSAIYIDETADLSQAAGRIVSAVSFNNGLLGGKPGLVVVHAGAAAALPRELSSAGARGCSGAEVERLQRVLFPDGVFDRACAGQPSRALARKAEIRPFAPSKILVAQLRFGGEDEPLSRSVPCPVVGLRIVATRDAARRAFRALESDSRTRPTLLYYGSDIRRAAEFGASVDSRRVLFNPLAEVGPHDWRTDDMPDGLLRRIPVIGPAPRGKASPEIALDDRERGPNHHTYGSQRRRPARGR